MAVGMSLGAGDPNHATAESLGIPASGAVGTFGNAALSSGLVTNAKAATRS